RTRGGPLPCPWGGRRDRQAIRPADPCSDRQGTFAGHMTDDHFERQFAALRDRFRVRLVDYRELLVDAQNLYVSSRDNEVVRRVKRIAHELAGASGTFGFPDLGELAADLEAAAD